MFQTLLEKNLVDRLVDGPATYDELFAAAASNHKRVQTTLALLIRNQIVTKEQFPTHYKLSGCEVAVTMKKQLLKEREINDFSVLLENPCTVTLPRKV